MTVSTTRRLVTSGGLELRSTPDGVTVEGHASTFNQPYSMGWFTEEVAPGAFTKTLSENPDVRFLINHEGLPLARTGAAGTLELSQDDSGLYVRATLDPTDPDVQRIVPKMARGDLSQMSFAFGAVKDTWDDAYSHRTLNELSLAGGDVSVVTYPANPNATISLRMRELTATDPGKFRAVYRALVDDRAGDASGGLRAALETLTAADDSAELRALAALLAVDPVAALVPDVVADPDPLAATAAAAYYATLRARVALELMKH